MSENSERSSMHAVDAWIKYIERFGNTGISVQKLVNHGYQYHEIIRLFEGALEENEPLSEEQLASYGSIV